jgi:hypothetical protein
MRLRAGQVKLRLVLTERLPQPVVGAAVSGLAASHGPPYSVVSAPVRRYEPVTARPSVPVLSIGGRPL